MSVPLHHTRSSGHPPCRRLLAFLPLLLAAFPRPLEAQNLLVNPTFAADSAGWSLYPVGPPNGAIAWAPFDMDSSPASGAALVTNSGSITAVVITLTQCVEVLPNTDYDGRAWSYLPPDQATQGGTWLFVNWYDASGCGGAQTFGPSSGNQSSPATWTFAQVSGQAPPDAVSARFYLAVHKAEAGGSFAGYFDSAFLGLSGTPVTLVSFEVE